MSTSKFVKRSICIYGLRITYIQITFLVVFKHNATRYYLILWWKVLQTILFIIWVFSKKIVKGWNTLLAFLLFSFARLIWLKIETRFFAVQKWLFFQNAFTCFCAEMWFIDCPNPIFSNVVFLKHELISSWLWPLDMIFPLF